MFTKCRAGGDQSTTYAPSPFYMTSKMKSLYLEGYNYSVFDLTKDDCVQIQVIYYNSIELWNNKLASLIFLENAYRYTEI